MSRYIRKEDIMAVANSFIFTDKAQRKQYMVFLEYCIDNAPTAYDLDKVVRELENIKLVRVEQCHEDYEIEIMTERNFNDAIEIVKRGGVK